MNGWDHNRQHYPQKKLPASASKYEYHQLHRNHHSESSDLTRRASTTPDGQYRHTSCSVPGIDPHPYYQRNGGHRMRSSSTSNVKQTNRISDTSMHYYSSSYGGMQLQRKSPEPDWASTGMSHASSQSSVTGSQLSYPGSIPDGFLSPCQMWDDQSTNGSQQDSSQVSMSSEMLEPIFKRPKWVCSSSPTPLPLPPLIIIPYVLIINYMLIINM